MLFQGGFLPWSNILISLFFGVFLFRLIVIILGLFCFLKEKNLIFFSRVRKILPECFPLVLVVIFWVDKPWEKLEIYTVGWIIYQKSVSESRLFPKQNSVLRTKNWKNRFFSSLRWEGSFALMIFWEHENAIPLRTRHSSVPINWGMGRLLFDFQYSSNPDLTRICNFL